MFLNFVKLQFEQMSFSGFGFWCLVTASLMPVRREEPGQQLLGLNITINNGLDHTPIPTLPESKKSVYRFLLLLIH